MDGLRRRAGRALLTLLALAASLGTAGAADAQQPFFMGLGYIPGTIYSSAFDISADGSAVVGRSRGADGLYEAFRWTRDSGIVGLGSIDSESQAERISADGTTVVGHTGQHAFQWTQEAGMMLVPGPPGTGRSRATGVTLDGSTVLGTAYDASGDYAHGFRWTKNGGVEDLALTFGISNFDATAISNDGSIIAGVINDAGSKSYYWTAEAGLRHLPVPQGFVFLPKAISADGKVIVGHDPTNAAFRWSEATGMVRLPLLPNGGNPIVANDLSADGSIIVGTAEPFNIPLIWDEVHGSRDFYEVLRTEYGLATSLEGWGPRAEVRGISADGRTIAGVGIKLNGQTEAWIAYLGPAPTHPADFDNDGDVDGADFLAWQRNVGLTSGATRAQGDANADGRVDAADLALWKSHFGAGGSAAALASPPSPVPEPSGLALAGPALAFYAMRRRFRHKAATAGRA